MTETTNNVPWRVQDNLGKDLKGWVSVLDADGNRICDIFPFARGGRGAEWAMQIAERIARLPQLEAMFQGDAS